MRPFLNREKKNIGIYRSSELIADRTGKMAIPYISSSLCVSVITAVDALIAGAFIGSDALAAVAAAAPLLAIESILHCLFGFGIDKLMIRAIGRGNRREADRIFGTVLITVLVSYIIVVAPILIWGRQFISVNLKDQAMAELIYQYCIPRLAMMPLLEICLCCERAFRIDGRAVLFSIRNIVCSVLNIILDIIMVSALGLGVRGLS